MDRSITLSQSGHERRQAAGNVDAPTLLSIRSQTSVATRCQEDAEARRRTYVEGGDVVQRFIFIIIALTSRRAMQRMDRIN